MNRSRKLHLVGRFFLIAGICLLAGGLSARQAAAHIGDYYNSVHFQSGKPDFGTLPRRAIIFWLGENDDRSVDPVDCGGGWDDRKYVELTENAYNTQLFRDERRREQLLSTADSYAAKADWISALSACRTLDREQHQTDGSLEDRLEVLQDATERRLRPGTPAALGVCRFLHALALDEKGDDKRANEAFQSISRDSTDVFLRPHVLYQIASIAYEEGRYSQALALYQRLLTNNPGTTKREATLIMIARCALLPKAPAERNDAVGVQALALLARDYPRSRFAKTEAGLKARISFLQGRYDQALYAYVRLGDMASAEEVRNKLLRSNPLRPYLQARLLAGYLRHLNDAANYGDYEHAVEDVERTRRSFSKADAKAFSRVLMSDVSLTVPYFYYRLYICHDQRADFLSLAHLADEIAARHGGQLAGSSDKGGMAPDVMVRLAETYYQARLYRKARRWARMALDAGGSDRAHYVYGATLEKLHRPAAALAQFDTLMARYPDSTLRRSAREETAIIDESLGDDAGALDQYFALGYNYDIAYMLDARMSEREIRGYLKARPQTPHYNLIAYSLGIRCLRDEKWGEAERWLTRVPHRVYVAYSKSQSDFDEIDSPKPLVACRDLSRLQAAIGRAQTPNARAAAIYRYAGYYYHHGTLLLYNNVLWNGDRARVFSFWWNSREATPLDDNIVQRHMFQHEVYARTLALCLQVARRYPRSPSAPAALYRAACAARKLADMNDWWREEDKHRHFWRQSVSLMNEVKERYPHSPLVPAARKYAMVFKEELEDPYR